MVEGAEQEENKNSSPYLMAPSNCKTEEHNQLPGPPIGQSERSSSCAARYRNCFFVVVVVVTPFPLDVLIG